MNWDKIVDELLARPTTVTSDMQSANVRVTGLYAVPKQKSLGEAQYEALCASDERKMRFPYCVF